MGKASIFVLALEPLHALASLVFTANRKAVNASWRGTRPKRDCEKQQGELAKVHKKITIRQISEQKEECLFLDHGSVISKLIILAKLSSNKRHPFEIYTA